MKLQTVLILAALVTASVPASADIYRRVDEKGRVHYSDRPMPGAVRVKAVTSQPTDPEAVAARTEAEQQQRQAADAAAKKDQTTANAAKAVNQDMAKVASERCKKAKEDYRVAIESQRLYRIDKNGEHVYLTSAEIDEARINARKVLDEACPKTGG
jgi:alanyl-tRNA synthetase